MLVNYAKLDYQRQAHHVRFARFVEQKKLTCMDCGGAGGYKEAILDDGSGPWYECGWCEGTGYMTPLGRGEWLRFKREEKREREATQKQVFSSTATQTLRRRKTMSNEATAARAARRTVNPEFQVHRLNPAGLGKADDLAHLFDVLLEEIKTEIPESRELSLVKTHLEIACFHAKKGIAQRKENQL